jgi:putative molybdopterin biosynthesis protein
MRQKSTSRPGTGGECLTAGPVTNCLASIRERRGVSASDLAAFAGVSRQTIYAVEAGTYVPNTAVALRLAKALDVSVADLFSLAQDKGEKSPRLKRVSLLPSAEDFYAGQPVQVCEVDGKLIATAATAGSSYLPDSDGVVAKGGASHVRGSAKIEFHHPGATLRNRLLLAGCDPALSLLARALDPAGIQLILVHQNSSRSLSLLKSGSVHIAGTHLRDEASGESNLAAVARLFPAGSTAVISFAVGEEGLVTAPQNPLGIRGVEDLAREDISFVNREPGSGSRTLLDNRLQLLRLPSQSIRGYEQTAPGHLAAAKQVYAGLVNCCLATQASARVFGLYFIPLANVRYDLVIRKPQLDHPGIQIVLDAVNRSDFRLKLKSAGGYDTSVTGERRQ